MYRIVLAQKDEFVYRRNSFGYALFIVGDLFVIPKHFVARFKHDLEIGYLEKDDQLLLQSVVNPDEKIPISFDDLFAYKQCTAFEFRDIVMCKCNAKMGGKKDIRKYFLSETSMVANRDWQCRFDSYDQEKPMYVITKGRFLDREVHVEDS